MRTIETTANVSEDGTLTIPVPPDVAPGLHRVVVVLEEAGPEGRETELGNFPVRDYGPWPENLSLRREDMYDEWGR
jgi:hypothetical protein